MKKIFEKKVVYFRFLAFAVLSQTEFMYRKELCHRKCDRSAIESVVESAIESAVEGAIEVT